MNNWYLLAAIPVFGLLVLVHEFGHFITARWAGIRVEEFGIGFPPALVRFRQRDGGGWQIFWFGHSPDKDLTNMPTLLTGISGGFSNFDPSTSHRTIYSLNLFPVGGFVRMTGENGDILDANGKYDAHSFAAQSAGKRIIVMLAGVAMNFLLAMLLFTIIYMQGEPTPDTSSTVGLVVLNSPAGVAGLQDGDKIMAVNGQPVKLFTDINTQVNKAIAADREQRTTIPILLTIQRPGSSQPLRVTVNALVHPPNGQGHLGITGNTLFVRAPLWQAPIKGIVHTYDVTSNFIIWMGRVMTGSIHLAPREGPSGPVGIAKITGQVAQNSGGSNWWLMVNLTAVLSLNLAILNLLPFPALDGGRILLILIELLRGGKRLKPEREVLINLIGTATILILVVSMAISDIILW